MGCPAGTHNTPYSYAHGCRCPGAMDAQRGLLLRRGELRRSGPIRPGYRCTTDVDTIAVERALLGNPPAIITVAERRAAVARLTALGRSAQQIADQLGVNCRTVHRYRVGWHKSLAGAA
jgi:hypothetical protein